MCIEKTVHHVQASTSVYEDLGAHGPGTQQSPHEELVARGLDRTPGTEQLPNEDLSAHVLDRTSDTQPSSLLEHLQIQLQS